MATNCPLCNSEIADDNPAVKQVALVSAVDSKGGWGWMEDRHVGYSFPAGRFTARIEELRTTPGYPANGYDGAYDQGTEYEARIIFNVDGAYFKKTGTGDSYGTISWDGEVTQVTPREKIVKVFE